MGDLHCGARGASPKFVDFFDKFFLDILFPYLIKNNINTILQTGDLFDTRKVLNVQALYDAKRYLFSRLEAHGIKMYTILGNHDIYFKNTVMVNSSSQVLGEYVDRGVVEIIENPTEITFGKSKFLFVPWICTDNEEEIRQSILKSDARFLMGHFELKGFEMHEGQVAEEGQFIHGFERYELVISGHYHHKSRKANIFYVGTCYEMDWKDFGDQKGFHIIDTDSGDLEFIPNPYIIHQKIIYNEDAIPKNLSQYKNCYVKLIVQKKTNQYEYEKFIDKLMFSGIIDLKIIDEIFVEMTSSNNLEIETEDTETLIEQYINSSEISNKEEVITYMHMLHDESLMMIGIEQC